MRPTVLYIDDERELPANAEGLLEQAGYDLVHTADPRDVLRRVRDGQVALVVAEVLIPGVDTFELIEQARGIAADALVPFVVLTRGERTPQLYGRALELGASDFLCKPITRAELLEVVLAQASSSSEQGADAAPGKPAAREPRRFEGSLEAQPFPELLGRLHRGGLSGVLRLRRGSEKRAIELRNGSPIEMDRPSNLTSIADYLLQKRQIDETQYEMLVDQLMAGIGGPRAILLGMEAMSEAKLEAATNEQARGALFEIFRWPAGDYTFQEGERLGGGERIELACDPLEVLAAGSKFSPNEVVSRSIARRSELYVQLSPEGPEALDRLGLSPEQRSAAQELSGEQTLAEVLETTALDERSSFALIASGAVQADEFPVLVLDEELKPEPEVEPQARGPITEVNRRGRGRGDAPDLGVLEATIGEMAERIASEDDFEILGIVETMGDAEVRSAHDALVASLHLDRIPADLDELRALGHKVRMRIEQAYQRVRLRDTRLAFAGLRKRKQVDRVEREVGTRAVEAETWFRKGKAALSNEDFNEAAEAFGMAMHCDPEQGHYAAYLGYALYRTDPADKVIRREALEHVAKGVKLAPDRGMPLLFLGRIFRESGDLAMAEKVLRKGLAIDPDNLGIVQEICLITGSKPEASKKGFIARLRGR